MRQLDGRRLGQLGVTEGPSESPQLYLYRGVRRVDFERLAERGLVAMPSHR